MIDFLKLMIALIMCALILGTCVYLFVLSVRAIKYLFCDLVDVLKN
jgi:hypothetical protein